jgi:DNA-directed RNA polymerase subunit RPC12/RpoP
MEFKGCTRCQGDLYREEDVGQTDLVCLQCGFRLPVDPVLAIGARFEQVRRARIRTQARPSRAAA